VYVAPWQALQGFGETDVISDETDARAMMATAASATSNEPSLIVTNIIDDC
jgi:hypothetical protein